MVKIEELTNYLDNLLKIKEIKDESLNGLVVENKGRVSKVALAVDASLETFKRAKGAGADFLFVHHGLWWGRCLPLRGAIFQKIKFLIENDIALYTAHLPLDLHPEFGNNSQLVKMLEWTVRGGFGKYGDLILGKEVFFNPPQKREELVGEIKDKLGIKPLLWDFGPLKIKRLGCVCGGAINLLPEAVEKGLDAYITGEPKHSYYWMAKEEKINVIFLGHYLSETLGVKAIGKDIEDKFGLEVEFLFLPTGH